VFELGGNDAAVVLEDAVVDDALIEQVAGAFTMTSGQVCFAIKRLYAHESVIDAVVDGLAARLHEHVVGDGLDPEVTMGPLANARQHERFNGLVNDARRSGAHVRTFGRLADDSDRDGYFQLPALVTGVSQQSRIVQEEQFGPALPVIGFRTDDEAVALANGTPFGLTSSVWTADSVRGWALADRIDAGVTFVNAHGMAAFDVRAPFGGVKGSGYGREMGKDGLLEFTVAQQAREPRPM
jgi:aldehyde dehydrogenase